MKKLKINEKGYILTRTTVNKIIKEEKRKRDAKLNYKKFYQNLRQITSI